MQDSPKDTVRNRSGSETRKRGPIIGFRATDAELATIRAAADRAGLTVGSYVRSRALAKPTTRAVRRPPYQTAQLAQLLGMLGTASTDLRRITTHLKEARVINEPEAEEAVKSFRAAASAILQALGKQPHDH